MRIIIIIITIIIIIIIIIDKNSNSNSNNNPIHSAIGRSDERMDVWDAGDEG